MTLTTQSSSTSTIFQSIKDHSIITATLVPEEKQREFYAEYFQSAQDGQIFDDYVTSMNTQFTKVLN